MVDPDAEELKELTRMADGLTLESQKKSDAARVLLARALDHEEDEEAERLVEEALKLEDEAMKLLEDAEKLEYEVMVANERVKVEEDGCFCRVINFK